MVPVGAIAAIVLWALRARTESAGGSATGHHARPKLGIQISAAVLVKGASWLGGIIAGTALLTAPGFKEAGVSFAVVFLCALYNFPHLIIFETCIRYGWVKPAYYLSWVFGEDWQHQGIRGAACLAAVRAAMHSKAPLDAPVMQWLSAKVRPQRHPPDLNWVAAIALLESREGPQRCRSLMLHLERMHVRSGRRCVRALARAWLVADSAWRMDYGHIRYLAAQARLLTDGRVVSLRGRIGRDLYGLKPTLAERLAMLLWRTPPLPLRPSHGFEAAGDVHALLQQVITLRAGPASYPDIKTVALAWASKLEEPAFAADLGRRIATHGATHTPDAARSEIASQVGRDLVFALLASRTPLPEPSTLAHPFEREIVQTARDVLASGVQLQLEELGARMEARQALNDVDEMAQSGAIWEAYLDAGILGGATLRATLFPVVNRALCNYAVQLDTHYGGPLHRALAHAIFRRLLAEAIALEDADTVTLMRRNCAATS
jgi:hypothetical protein